MNDTLTTDACTAFGAFVRDLRKDLGETAKAVAIQIGMQPSNYCKLEYGALQPPGDPKKLALLADALELPAGQNVTHKFYDLAGEALGTIPSDVAEIISRGQAMPMMLRTLGCRKLSQEDIEQVVALIRGKA